MKSITAPSYAKVNLYLDILGLRADGYHELEMINSTISLHDTITCESRQYEGIILKSGNYSLPEDDRNLAYKAAQRFIQQTRSLTGARIFIEKKIPVGAGLGGGSSNAATVLTMLNQLSNCPLSDEGLMYIGAGIGADVPFFIKQGCCYVKGIGEKVIKVFIDHSSIDENPYIVLCSPSENVSTKEAYALWDQSLMKKHSSPRPLLTALMNGHFVDIHRHLFNSFESVIYSDNDTLKHTYQDFCSISPTAPMLSGSGSNLFSIHTCRKEAEKVMSGLQEKGYKASVCELLF